MYRFPVKEIKSGALSKRRGHAVVVMQHYPRFVAKDLIAEYVRALAPDRELFTEFKALDRQLKNHNLAFDRVRYEERFSLSDDGIAHLKRLSDLARDGDVYLLCQCVPTQKCHCDLLLITARAWCSAPTQSLWHRYPVFEARIADREPGAF